MTDRLQELADEPEGSMERAIADYFNEGDLHLQRLKKSEDQENPEA